MSDPSYALQKSVYDALVASGVASSRVFHRVPQGTPLPYIHIGHDQIITDYIAGADFNDCTVTIHAFAKAAPELKLIVGLIRNALDRQITLVGFGVHEWGLERVEYMTDPDGLTEHAVLEFRYYILASDG